MTASKRPILVFLLTNAIALSLVFALVVSCKKTDDPGTGGSSNLTTIQGNWRLTALNVSPAYTDPRLPIPISELVGALNGFEGGCVANTTLSFNNSTVTSNAASVSACTNATLSKQLFNSFFGPSTTYTESSTQVVLKGTQTITANKTLGTNTATLVTQLPVDPGNQPNPTSYTMVLTKQ